ncbi:MAG: polyisoprenoid-binding protein [Gammaproteobacteria bacterium]|nr:polyisoprenoid-binding protein [Gammaproteobacteria bacterium]
MFKKQSLFCLLLLSFCMPSLAANYTIEPSHTYPSLEFSHMGLSIWRGKFNKTSGKVTLDRAAKTGSTEIIVDIASIDFGMDLMNEYALKTEWLNVTKFPTMTYKGTIKFDGATPIAVDGQLTLLGITKPLKLKINQFNCLTDHPYYKTEVCGADAEGDLNRADFGLTQYTENNAGKIHLRIQVEAIKDK